MYEFGLPIQFAPVESSIDGDVFGDWTRRFSTRHQIGDPWDSLTSYFPSGTDDINEKHKTKNKLAANFKHLRGK